MDKAASDSIEEEWPQPFDKLSRRQRECLVLVYHRKTSKDIAAELGISPPTVDGYLTEAMRLLGERNRRTAAEVYCRACGDDPWKFGGQSPRVATPAPPPPSSAPPAGDQSRTWLPLRRKGAAHNDLTALERLAFIPAIALAYAIGFGLLAIGLRFVGDLAVAIFHAAR